MNNYAVSSDGIATALQDSASALMEAGNNFEQATALVAAANRVVQDPNSVGAGLRTISLRLRGTSVEVLEEMGEETDGLVESTSKLQEKLKALTGVDIIGDNGDYKDTYTILKEIAQVWEDIDPMNQAAALELMAGKNRANILAAILGNMKDLEGAYQSALSAEGSALKENETHLDSIQGRVELFTNAVQTMWMTEIDSDFIKGIVDIGTALVNLTKDLGLFKTAFAAVLTYMSASSKYKFDLAGMLGIHDNDKGKDKGFFAGFSIFGKQGLTGQIAKGLKGIAKLGGKIGAKFGRRSVADAVLGSPQDVQASVQDFADIIQKDIDKYVTVDTTKIDTSIDRIQRRLDVSRQQLTKAKSMSNKEGWAYYKSLGSLAPAQDRDANIAIKTQEVKELEQELTRLQAKRNELVNSAVNNAAVSMAQPVAHVQQETQSYQSMLSVLGKIQKVKLSMGDEAHAATVIDKMSMAAKTGQVDLANYVAGLGDADIALKAYAASVKDGNYSLAGFQQFIAQHNASLKASGVAAKAAAVMHQALNMALSMGISMLVSSAINLVIQGFNKLANSAKEAAEAADQAIDKYKSTQKTLQNQKKTVDDLSKSYQKLSKGVNLNTNKNINLTTDSYQDYLDVCNDIADMFPNLVTGFDAQGNAILSLKGNVDQLTQAYKDAAQAARQQMISGGTDIWNTFKNTYNADPYSTFDNVGLVQQVTLAKKLQELMNEATEDEINDFIDKLQSSEGITIDGNKYTNLELMKVLQAMGVGTNWANYAEWQDFSGKVDIEKFKQTATKVNAFVKTTTAKINTETSKVVSLMDAYLGEDLNYATLSDECRSYINQIVANLDAEFINSFENADALYNWIKTNIVDAFKDESVVKAFSDFSQLQLDLKDGKIDYSEYKDRISDFVEQLQTKLDEDTMTKIKIGLGLDEDSFEVAENHIFELLGMKKKQIDPNITGPLAPEDMNALKMQLNLIDKIGSLSIEDLKIAAELEVPEGVVYTWEELLQKIKEVKKNTGISVISTKTYSSLVSDAESHNEALSQTSEIIADNIKITEEYKESLKELGISEKDLADCFYENNPLVVKNAAKLRDLVDTSKETTIHNVKLAKSQAKLKYYEKYKELQNLTKGQKISTAATLSQVKAIYAEMTALQKSITRYSMLEHKLLGATNAYEEFAKAQDIDSENDYESKAEELVGYLVDAFHTAKLGTESAQAAIKGLVPESVYKDLDTLDEKMQAVFDYFTTDLSKYFYVRFNDDGSLESAEMLIDNVKQFVEDGIGNGVFTGSWKEWDLDKSINSLDELAEKMGVTKEVAYAFLQAMETYDISWIGGDASTLLDKLIPSTAEIENFANSIQDQLKNTSIDIKVQPYVDTETLKKNGYTVEEGQLFEVLSYQDTDGKYVNLTPVLPNGEVVEKEKFDKYIEEQLNSGNSLKDLTIDGYKVYVKSYDTKEAAEQAAKQLESDVKDYQNMVKSYSLENEIYSNTQKRTKLQYEIGTGKINADDVVDADGKTTASEQLIQLNEEADANAQAARENASAWTEANEAYTKAKDRFTEIQELYKSAAEEGNDKQVSRLQKELQKAESAMWDTYAVLVKLGEPTEVILTVAMEQVQKDLTKIKATMNETELDIVSQLNIETLEKDANGNWIVNLDAYSNLDESSKTKVQQYLNYLSEEHNINILQGEGATTTLDVLTEIKDILSKTYELMVKTDDAQTQAQSFFDIWDGIKDKAVTLTTNIVEGFKSFFTRTPDEGDGTDVNGTAHVRGTAFAGGSWGASETGTSLVGELGPEILVRGNHWTTVGENGAEFTHVKKGDIIFNHKQSEQLLKNGYVTSRGKAYASGTAYNGVGSVYPWPNGMSTSKNWENITPTLWNDATNGEYLKDTIEDAADKFEEIFDWIEVRLEEWDEKLGLINAQLENMANYAEKNAKLEEAISTSRGKLADVRAGADYYEKYAQQFLDKLSPEHQKYAMNGAISIEDFIDEVGEDVSEEALDAIQKYREYIQKSADLRQQEEELLTEIRGFYIQQIDNAEHSGAVRATIEDSQTEKLKNAVEFDEARGLITNPNYYSAMMENTERKIVYKTKARDEMQKEFDDAVKSGVLEVGSDEWYENLDKLYQIDAEIDSANIELEEFQNAINDIYWDAFDELINRFDYISDETQGLIDLMSEVDMVTKPDDKNGWGADDVSWTDEGLATLGLHAQEMERAEEKAKAYGVAIDELNAEYEAGHYSEAEYHEKLNELTQGQYDAIETAQEEKEAIIELNEQRVEAIKEGIEKQIEAYEELINKKKEELSAEKDLYDFQKQAAEGQKSIADIERKLTALSADNSAAAVAEKKRLEAELAEARANQEELYYDRSIENQENALDKELEDFTTQKESEIEMWEQYLTDVEKVVADSLSVVQENTTSVYNTLEAKANEYGLTLSDAVMNPWLSGSGAIDEYTTKFGDSVSKTTEQLETIRSKWQEIKEELQAANVEADKYYKAGTADGASVSDINKENAGYVDAKPSQNKSSNKPNNSNNKPNNAQQSSQTDKVSKGSTVAVKSSATHFSSNSGGVKMASFVPGGKYTVYEVDGNQALIGINGAYTGWVSLKDLEGYAKGTSGVKKDELAWIDEMGLEEVVLHADGNGKLAYLSKGSSVIPHDISENLMQLGQLDPSEILNRNRPQIVPSSSVVNNEVSINMNIAEVVHIDKVTNDTLPDLTKAVEKQMDSYMAKINNSLKRYTR